MPTLRVLTFLIITWTGFTARGQNTVPPPASPPPGAPAGSALATRPGNPTVGSLETEPRPGVAPRMPATESDFVQMVRRAELDGHQLAQLAAGKAQSIAVREFAQNWLAEQRRHADAAGSLYTRFKADGPHPVDQVSSATYERLKRLEGAEFDRAFIEVMQEASRTNSSRFIAASGFATTPAVVQFITAATPGMQWAATALRELALSMAPPASGAETPNQNATQPFTATDSSSEPAVPAPRPNTEEWYPWMIGAAVFFSVILVILAWRVLRRRSPRHQPVR